MFILNYFIVELMARQNKKADLTQVFGSLKRKLNGQEFKDLVKEKFV